MKLDPTRIPLQPWFTSPMGTSHGTMVVHSAGAFGKHSQSPIPRVATTLNLAAFPSRDTHGGVADYYSQVELRIAELHRAITQDLS